MPFRTLPPTPRKISRLYIQQNRFEFLLGLLGLVAGIAFFIDPTARNRSAVGMAVSGPLDELWSACYAVGGLLVCLGLAWRWHRAISLEVAGLWLLLAAILVNAITAIDLRGLAAGASLGPFAVVSWALLGKLRDIRCADRAVQEDGNGR